MKHTFCIAAILLLALKLCAQTGVNTLSVGDAVPDVTLTNMMNYKSATAKLSGFKNNLVILDFWSTWCSACLSLFPHMDSLQQQFNGNLQVVLVNTKTKITGDNSTRIKNALALVKKRTGVTINLPVVYGCEALDRLFPCQTIPHEVWIKNGKVIAITSATEVTAANIKAITAGEHIALHQKKDIFNYNSNEPLFMHGDAQDSAILYRTLITGYIEGMAGGSGMRMKNDKITGFYVFNSSLLSLTRTVYPHQITLPANRIVVESANKYFAVEPNDTAYYNHTYCYDLITPPCNEETVHSYMQQDLKKYFNITQHKEVRKLKCIVLTKNSTARIDSSKQSPNLDLEPETRHKFIDGYSPAEVARLLNLYTAQPVIDETGITTSMDADLPYDLNNITALQSALAKCGLLVKEEERPVEVIVITDL